jgi:uncharacterized membrane protein YczE
MTVHANIGAPPWDVFHLGAARHMGWTLGAANIVTAVVIVLASAMMKEFIGLGTLCNMIAIGAFIDLIRFLRWVRFAVSFEGGAMMMIAGLFVVAVGGVAYMGAGYGFGPRDSLMVAMAKRTGRTAGFCRCCMEAAALFAGWLLGERVGIGALIAAFGQGIAIQIVFSLLRFDVKKIHNESFVETCRRLFSRFASKDKGAADRR